MVICPVVAGLYFTGRLQSSSGFIVPITASVPELQNRTCSQLGIDRREVQLDFCLGRQGESSLV